MNKFATTAALCGILCAQASFAQEEDPNAVIEAEKAALKQNAANEVVQEDLAEPDGVSLAMADDGSYQIFARGTGTYDFGDEDDRQDALQEATQKAKANLSKFLSETISSVGEQGADQDAIDGHPQFLAGDSHGRHHARIAADPRRGRCRNLSGHHRHLLQDHRGRGGNFQPDDR